MRPRFAPREVGPATIVALALTLGVLWALSRPAEIPLSSYIGQFLGAEAILLFSIGLVLISTLPWVEVWFDGIDRAAIWHRRVGILGLVLVLVHWPLASGTDSAVGQVLAFTGATGLVALVVWAILPRWRSVVPGPLRGLVVAARDAPGIRSVRTLFGGYESWRLLHRTTGLFVTAGFLHGVMQSTAFDRSAALRWTSLAIGGVGVAFYVYRELFSRFVLSPHDYQVETVRDVGQGLIEIAMKPLGRHLDFVPGQFAMVYLEAKNGWHRHPFTISSAPSEGVLRVTIKALGDYTSRVQELVEPGMPAVVGGPLGRFSYPRGTDRQLWIAAGVGGAPFLSWLRALGDELPQHVVLFYSNDGAAPFAEEIGSIADRHPTLHAHIVDTSRDGRLTSAQVLAATDGSSATCRSSCADPGGCCAPSSTTCAERASRLGASIASTSTGAERRRPAWRAACRRRASGRCRAQHRTTLVASGTAQAWRTDGSRRARVVNTTT